MWQEWLLGILGLWIILMPFLGLTPSLSRILLIVTGVLVAVLGFWTASGDRSAM